MGNKKTKYKNKNMKLATLLFLGAVSGIQVKQKTAQPPSAEELIAEVDKNEDGVVQLREVLDECKGDVDCEKFTTEMFEHINTDVTDGVNAEELQAFIDQGPPPMYGGYGGYGHYGG